MVDNIQGVLNWSQQVEPLEAIAIDVERASTYRYSSRAYLIQLKTESAGILIIDPLAFTLPPSFIELINSHPWVLHAARQDLPSLAMEGFKPIEIFDTEVAARLLGMPRVSLGALTEELLQIKLAKEHSAADWSKRPIPTQWLNYAALDVDFLLELKQILIPALEYSGKWEYAIEEFEFESSFSNIHPPLEPWRQTKGIAQLRTPKQLAILRALWQFRDELARREDVATFSILRDRYLIDMSKAALLGKAQFEAATPKPLRNKVKWWQVARSARQLGPVHLPSARTANQAPDYKNWPRRYPDVHSSYQLLRQNLIERADELHMPVENLISPNPVRTWVFEQVTARDSHLSNQLSGAERQSQIEKELIAQGARKWQAKIVALEIVQLQI